MARMYTESNVRTNLISFLRDELAASDAASALALRKGEQDLFLLMVLWQYEPIALSQLDRVFDWLEMV